MNYRAYHIWRLIDSHRIHSIYGCSRSAHVQTLLSSAKTPGYWNTNTHIFACQFRVYAQRKLWGLTVWMDGKNIMDGSISENRADSRAHSYTLKQEGKKKLDLSYVVTCVDTNLVHYKAMTGQIRIWWHSLDHLWETLEDGDDPVLCCMSSTVSPHFILMLSNPGR